MPGPHAVNSAETSLLSIMRAEKETSNALKMTRSYHREKKLAINDAYEETGGLLYAPGIAD